MLNLTSLAQLDVKNGLVGLEDHACVHLEVLVQIEPGAVCARLVVEAVDEPPGVLIWRENNMRLVL